MGLRENRRGRFRPKAAGLRGGLRLDAGASRLGRHRPVDPGDEMGDPVDQRVDRCSARRVARGDEDAASAVEREISAAERVARSEQLCPG